MKSILFLLSVFIGYGNANAQSFSTRVVGGGNAKMEQAPFIVSLRKYNSHFCGGSLINESWVVTAAHCIEGEGKPDDVLVGSVNINGSSGSKKLAVSGVFIHPNYNRYIESGSDFALVKLKDKATVEFAELNDTDPALLNTTSFSVAGWGALDESGYSNPSILQILDVPFVDQKTCENQFQKFKKSSRPYLDDSMLCAGYASGGKDACQGDSGGPLFYRNSVSMKFVLTGVVSWGYGCARKNMSGVYSNIANGYDWITDTIKNN